MGPVLWYSLEPLGKAFDSLPKDKVTLFSRNSLITPHIPADYQLPAWIHELVTATCLTEL